MDHAWRFAPSGPDASGGGAPGSGVSASPPAAAGPGPALAEDCCLTPAPSPSKPTTTDGGLLLVLLWLLFAAAVAVDMYRQVFVRLRPAKAIRDSIRGIPSPALGPGLGFGLPAARRLFSVQSAPASGTLPLEGYRVLDMTRVLAGVRLIMNSTGHALY